MHAYTLLVLVLACGLQKRRHALLVQGLRVQNSTKAGTQLQSSDATLLPNLSIFESPRAHFVAEVIRFDRMNRGPVTLYRDGNALILSGTKAHLVSVDDEKHLVQLGPTGLAGYLSSAEPLSSAGNSEWYLARLNTFEDGGSADGTWSYTSTSVCEASYDKFLGGHCKLAGKTVRAAYLDLPDHKKLKIKARVHFFDKWEGESVYVKANGKIVWASKWSLGLCAPPFGSFGINLSRCTWSRIFQLVSAKGRPSALKKLSSVFLGNALRGFNFVPVEIELSHTGPALLLSFGSTMPKKANPCTASWGIDDVAIYLF